jgi:hypothetical protein
VATSDPEADIVADTSATSDSLPDSDPEPEICADISPTGDILP